MTSDGRQRPLSGSIISYVSNAAGTESIVRRIWRIHMRHGVI